MADYENMNISEVLRLAKQGNGDALFEMAWRLEAMPSDLPVNDPAYRCAWQDYWFERAADTGHIDARSRYARSLINRVFDAECRQKAMKYFESLVRDFDAGKLKGDSELDGVISKLWLGIMLCQGLGTRRDAVEGAKLLKEADNLTNGFAKFGYEALKNLAETYGQGCTQPGGEPSVDDLRQAIAYQRKAIDRFDPAQNDPNNRGFLGLSNDYLRLLEERKAAKEAFKDSASPFGYDTSNPGTNPDFNEWQDRMMQIPYAAVQRNNEDKAALARIRQSMAREGW
jgi:hypothetical protein